MGISAGAEVRFKQIPIGSVLAVKLTKDLSAVEYQLELQPEFAWPNSQRQLFCP